MHELRNFIPVLRKVSYPGAVIVARVKGLVDTLHFQGEFYALL